MCVCVCVCVSGAQSVDADSTVGMNSVFLFSLIVTQDSVICSETAGNRLRTHTHTHNQLNFSALR